MDMSQADTPNTMGSSRRALLTSAVAAAALTGAAGVDMAAIAANHGNDAELLQLGRKMDALSTQYWRILELDAPWREGYNALVDEFRQRHKDGEKPNGAEFLARLKEIEDRYRQTNPSADDVTDAMDGPARRIMALPAHSIAGLAVKARAAAFACSHFYGSEFRDADWDHMHVRTLIDAVLAMAGQPPMDEEDGFGAEPSPNLVDPALIVAVRFLDADKAYDDALDRRRVSEEALNHEDSALVEATKAAMEAADTARGALFHVEPITVLGAVALLEALTKNDTCESPIEMETNGGAGDNVNNCLRRLAAVLREVAE
jgi:hypothetical protein